jgi:Zn-dependent protease with chaperone function
MAPNFSLDTDTPHPKAGRAATVGVPLKMMGFSGKLALASGVTLALLFGMVFVLIVGLLLIAESDQPGLGLILGIVITIVVNVGIFFLSPFLMDLTQRFLYGTRWVELAEIQRHSPEAAAVIQRVCCDRNLKQPRLGIIDDQNPTAFTYGSVPNSARLVVSRGLFTYLDDDEIATVYAHELGHIVNWDFALMTAASTLVQITYLIYIFSREIGRGGDNDRAKAIVQTLAIAAYLFYIVGTYLILYLSRVREYFADRFAAETTGNPNALSRALVKIAYGIVEEGQRATEPSHLMEGTRALGIYDARAATSTGTAYRVAASPERVGRVFLWDLFNPWGWWMELISTHPLTGKRVRALSTYAEQLGLGAEFDMGRVVAAGRRLNKQQLYGGFLMDLAIYTAPTLGLILGLAFALAVGLPIGYVAFPMLSFGFGLLLKTIMSYSDFHRAPYSDVLTLMSDPYASPLRGQPVKLDGTLIGRGDAGYSFGSDLKLQDKTGMLFVRYVSRFGALGNFLFGMKQVKALVGTDGTSLGWFRRGVSPWMDLIRYTSGGKEINSYPRFWGQLASILLIGGGILVLLLWG